MLEQLVVFVQKEWRELKEAPFSFIMLAVLCLGVGFSGGMLYYSSQIASLHEQINSKDAQLGTKDDELKAKDGQISRYQVVLGIKPGSAGALVELNNQELALKAQSIVAKLREYNSVLEAKGAAIKGQLADKKVDKDQASKADLAAIREVSQDFDSSLASDTYNVENELRSRLGPSALSHVIMVPGFIADHNPRTRITFPDMMRGSGFDAMWLGRMADEIEQMAKLLPPDSAKK